MSRSLLVRSLLLIAGVCLLGGCNLWPAETNPFTTIHPVTDFGRHTQELYEFVTWWVSGIAVAVAALMAFVLVRFRHDGSPGNPVQVHGNPQLEFAWTLLPVLIVIAITVPTIRTIFVIGDAAPADSLEVRVIGKRWWWEFQYVDSGVVTANEMHLPVGKPISLLLESDTVIHSFWVPRLGGKRDAVPGRINRIWFTIDSDVVGSDGVPAEFLGECAEFCGVQHAKMRKRVYAHTQDSFDAWLQTMKTPVVLADKAFQQEAETLFGSAGCSGCHAVTGNKSAVGRTGPNLTHFGDRHSLGAGAKLLDGLTDEEKAKALHAWIKNPDDFKFGTTKNTEASRVLDGMNIPRELSDAEIDTLVKYLMAQK